MLFEVIIRIEHIPNDATGNSVLVIWSINAPDHPEDLCDLLLSRGHGTIARQPDRQRLAEIKEPWRISQS